MSRLRQALQRIFGVTPPPGVLRSRAIDTNFSIIKGNCVATPPPNVGLTQCAEGDRVILHGKQPSLLKALKRGEKFQTPSGAVEHDSIIGKRVWDTVQSRKGQYTHFSVSLDMTLILPLCIGLNLRFSLPTLAEYVALTPRLVTPVCASLLRIRPGDTLDSRYPSRSIHRMPI